MFPARFLELAQLMQLAAAPEEVERGVHGDDGRAAGAVHEGIAALRGDDAKEHGGETDADVERPEVLLRRSRPCPADRRAGTLTLRPW